MKNCRILFVIALFSISLHATTWRPVDIKCPVCQEENEFAKIGSYGSYIYQWPSKFQYIYWPLTDSHVIYSCKKCYLTCYMWDFRRIPKDKIAQLKEVLAKEKIDWKDIASYRDIPMTTRLNIAEKVYLVLDKEPRFWCDFYRTFAYHYDKAQQHVKANEVRGKALQIAQKLIENNSTPSTNKELLLITGAMHYFLANEKTAKENFQKALQLTYNDPQREKEYNQGFNAYLTDLLAEYIGNDEKNNPLREEGKKLVHEQLQKLESKTTDELINILKNETTFIPVKLSILRNFSFSDTEKEKLIPAFIYALNHSNKYIQMSGIRGLGNLEEKAETAIPNLIKILNTPELDSQIKYVVLGCIGKIGVKAQEVIDHVIPYVDHEEMQIQIEAIETIGKIGRNSTQSVPVLLRIFNNRENENRVRAYAAEALGMVEKNVESAIPSLIQGLGEVSDYPDISEYASEALLKMGSKAISELQKAQNSENESIKNNALQILQKLQK